MPGITAPLSQSPFPYFTGLLSIGDPVHSEVVLLSDHWYLLDLESDRYKIASIPALRPQADTSERVGEQTLTVEGLWRRIISSWHHGAGQDWYDRNDGDLLRFRSSRGVDPWTEWQLSLLPDVTEVATNAGGWSSMTVGEFSGGQRLVAAGPGGKCITVNAAGTISTVLGLTGNCYVASSGGATYVADNTDIWLINAAGTGVTSFNANVNAGSPMAFVKNRLIVGVGTQVWDVINSATAAAHYTNPWTGWIWTGFAEGPNTIYGCGYAGDRGLVFSIPIKSDGTGLDAPRVAVELPHGELPLSIVGYVGFVIIGTNKGVRVATPDAEGALTYGALVGEAPARCLEPQETFVWFGWDNAFANASGLGRVDLARFTEPLAPAYASDLMAPIIGQVNAATTFDNRRWFTTDTKLYKQSDLYVGEGYVESGTVTFNIADEKAAVFVDLRHDPLLADESIRVEGKEIGQSYVLLGASSSPNTIKPLEPLPVNHARAVGHELKATLDRAATGDGPVLTGIILAAQPAPQRSFVIFLPVIIATTVNVGGIDYPMNPAAEVDYLRELANTQQLIRYVQGGMNHLVFVEDYEWIPHHATVAGEAFNGTMVLKLKSAELV